MVSSTKSMPYECSVTVVVIFTIYVLVIVMFSFIVMIILTVYWGKYAKNYVMKSDVLTIFFCVCIVEDQRSLLHLFAVCLFSVDFCLFGWEVHITSTENSGYEKKQRLCYNFLTGFHSNYLKLTLDSEKYFVTNFNINTILEV